VVLAVGKLAPGLVLRAEWLYDDTQADFLDDQVLSWFGALLALAGLLLGGIGVRWLVAAPDRTRDRRREREVRG
jgi:hypothetical protein